MFSKLKINKPELAENKWLNKVAPPSTIDALYKLINPGKGLFTSAGANYNNDIFGRDSLIASRELLDWDPQIAREVILTLASLQGTKSDKKSNEEPGRIIHESREFDTWKTDLVNNIFCRYASYFWGGERGKMTTYFSVDSTPLYVHLVADYVKREPGILKEKVTRNNGKEITIEQSLIEATNWITGHIGRSGLIEVGRKNPVSLFHHTWKDSPTGYIHSNGEMANVFKPIAYLNVQLLSADALIAASKMFKLSDPDSSEKLLNVAKLIQANTLEKFWMKDKKFFASAIDRDSYDNHRLLKTLQSDAFWTLNSTLFDEMSSSEREKYMKPIIEKMFSKEFLTDAGIRCRALKHRVINMAGYHGSHAVWPIDTEMAAKGLRRQGFEKLADQLEARLLNSINMSGNHYEFFYVMPDGKVVLDLKKANKKRGKTEVLPIQMRPETDIAWTVAATFAIKLHNGYKNHNKSKFDPKKWQLKLEKRVISSIKNIQILQTVEELSKEYPEQPKVYLDIKKGNNDAAKDLTSQVSKMYFDNIKNKRRKSSKLIKTIGHNMVSAAHLISKDLGSFLHHFAFPKTKTR